MIWIIRHVLAIGVAILPSIFAVSSSVAQSCQFNGNCKLPLTCQPGLFGGYCAVQACNADTDCRNGSTCFWELALLSARATLIATGGKSAFPVKLAEVACNVPRLVLAAVAVAAAPPATTLKAASAGQYDGAL